MSETNEMIVSGYRSMKRIRIVNSRFYRNYRSESHGFI